MARLDGVAKAGTGVHRWVDVEPTHIRGPLARKSGSWLVIQDSTRQRGLAGVRLVISDHHLGLKGAIE